ncbi:lipid-transfer protein [Elongatibacter sediminis]|uniref:propanoyl-CoA C-acyltransferase n=1 Tax=Elongatibacter sediminis TaxID=3119006 RepID=A0AAW9RGP7_9GAMM
MAETAAKHARVAGTGMVPFAKPGRSQNYIEMGAAAVRGALADAGLDYTEIQQVYAGYVYGDSTCGQQAVYPVGMTGLPVFNVNNNCATGSTALYLARQTVESGAADCVLALGFEQMQPGAIASVFTDRPSPFDPFDRASTEWIGQAELPPALRYFGGAGLHHMRRHGSTLEDLARIRAKASRHARHNEYALLRDELSVDDVLSSPPLWPGVMTRLMACPPTCGAAAAVVVSPGFARRRGIRDTVMIRAQAMTTDTPATFSEQDMMKLVGWDMTRRAARACYEAAAAGPEDIGVAELHDCFAHNELISYEALGLCPEGGASGFIADGDNTYGGRVVTNPSGGLLSKGHPLGATGLAQCHELVRQLRGAAGPRQVERPGFALQHNIGLGGACVVTLYESP